MAIAILIASCSIENEQTSPEKDALELNAKSSNSLSDLYFELIKNHFTKPKDFDNLPLATKVDLYEFKYDLFMNENILTEDQKEAVKGLKTYVQNLDFEAYDLPNDKVIDVYSKFDYVQGTFLLGHLGNSPIDYDPPIETYGCWWCWVVIEVTNPCHMEYVDGQPIGYYETVTAERRGIFGIATGEIQTNILQPCGNYDPEPDESLDGN